MKRLFTEAAPAFVAWLFAGAQFVQLVSTELENETIYADILGWIMIEGQMALLHLEFQKKRDGDMARRLWEYNARATLKYEVPVWSCVIYLAPDSTVEACYRLDYPNGWAIHRFSFSVIKMWEVSTQELLDPALRDLAPLLPLTREGKRREVVETAISLLDPPEGERKGELLTLAYGIASLAFANEADQDWLDWRFGMLYDILKDTRAFRKLAEEGHLQGLEEGQQEGRLQGRLQEGRLAVQDLIEARFADAKLLEQARAHVESITDPDALRQLIVQVALLQKAEDLPALLAQYSSGASQPARKRATRPRTSRKKAAGEAGQKSEP